MSFPYRLLIALLFVACHLRGLDLPPNGFHKWRETDTASVAENYATESMKFLMPRVNVRGSGSGIVGMELPVYNYATALIYRAFGFSHVWPRSLSLIAGLFLIFGIEGMIRRLTGNAFTARIGMLLAAFSPLVTFYSSKIQPDVLGLALTVWGFVHFLDWTDVRSKRKLGAAAICLALAGSIKPTFLFVGLPMAWILWQEHGRRALRDPWVLGLAALVLVPVVAWLAYARHLSARFGSEYFYLGGNLLQEMSGVLTARFYQNVFLTWPWELALGLPGTLLLVFGLRRLTPAGTTMVAWLLGSLVVFVLAAEHCATPHDYYYLPAVPALVCLAASAATRLFEDKSYWRRALASVVLMIAPVYGYGRIVKRYDFSQDFAANRAQARALVEPGALAVAVDKIPGDLLYRTGLKGFRLAPPLDEAELVRVAKMGARYLITPTGDGLSIRPIDISTIELSMP